MQTLNFRMIQTRAIAGNCSAFANCYEDRVYLNELSCKLNVCFCCECVFCICRLKLFANKPAYKLVACVCCCCYCYTCAFIVRACAANCSAFACCCTNCVGDLFKFSCKLDICFCCECVFCICRNLCFAVIPACKLVTCVCCCCYCYFCAFSEGSAACSCSVFAGRYSNFICVLRELSYKFNVFACLERVGCVRRLKLFANVPTNEAISCVRCCCEPKRDRCFENPLVWYS